MFSQYFFAVDAAPHFIVALKTFSSTPRVSDKKTTKKSTLNANLSVSEAKVLNEKIFLPHSSERSQSEMDVNLTGRKFSHH